MNKLFYLKSAQDFCESLLLGNGRIGVAAFGGVNEDVYALNDDTLWSGYPREFPKNKLEAFDEIKSLVLSGDVTSAEALFTKKLAGHWSQCYLPAGNLVIKGNSGNVTNYKRELTLDTALHTVEFDGYKREAFVSFPDDVICIRYDGKLPELEITLDGHLKPKTYIENGILFLEGEAPGDGRSQYIKEGGDHHTYCDEPQKRGMRYGIGVKIKTDGTVLDNKVIGATWLELYATIKTSFAGYDRHPYTDGIDYKSEIIKILERAGGYDDIKKRHIDDFSALFNRVSFEIEGGREDLPTDERLLLHKSTPDNSLYALIYQFGRYLTISSSRQGTQPTNLQGIWNVLPAPPWSSNYTVNINTQMNYWGTLGANLHECCEPLNRFVCELAKTGKATAENMFGADGFCVNHNVDIWRITHPVGGWSNNGVQWGYFPIAGAWLTRHLYDYYLDTKDLEFLNGEAFDAIMDSARFCDSMLEEVDGKLVFTPANSPENRYVKGGEKLSLTTYSAMYQSIVRDAFEICIAVCDITGRDGDFARYLEKRLENIPWLSLTSDGHVAEWDEDFEENDVRHRHISHLYSFYPAKKVCDPAFIDACKKTLDVRGDRSTGWSCAWKICLWASLGESERALKLCDELLTPVTDRNINMHDGGGVYISLLCAHPPFQIDGNFGYIAGINEMLTAFYEGRASLPHRWKNGKVSGIRINGKTIDIEWKNGKKI